MSTPIQKNIAQRLRALRQKRGMTQSELSEHTGIRQGRLSHFELEYREPSPDELAVLADALETDVDYLLGRSSTVSTLTPSMQRLLRKIERLTKRDLDVLSTFVDSLAKQRKR